MERPRRHYAVIPARAGSKGFPGKNRLFFNFAADFLDRSRLFKNVLVTTDDPIIADFAARRAYFAHSRPAHLAQDTSRIKDAITDLIEACNFLTPDDYLWLIYATNLHRSLDDFRAARAMLEAEDPPAFCTFIPAVTHPYITWYQEHDSGKMRQFIPNDAVNRQDLPLAFRNYHYIIGFKVGALSTLNSNLLGPDTRPIYLDRTQQEALCDLDEPGDLLIWKRKHPGEFTEWKKSLPPDLDLHPIQQYLDEQEGR